jgi:hypothetical protein
MEQGVHMSYKISNIAASLGILRLSIVNFLGFAITSSLLLLVLPALGCAKRDGQQAAYLPTEAGLTLQFANGDAETAATIDGRTQIRVSHSKQTPEGLEVDCSVATLQGSTDIKFLYTQDGGVFLIASDTDKIVVLPPGFPDKTLSWQSEGVSYQVIGRARAGLPGADLPDPIGVWVEAVPIASHLSNSGAKARIFFLPGIGEAETMVFSQGAWKTINRLVGRGFTDAPL